MVTAELRGGDVGEVTADGHTSRRPLKSGEGIIAAELPLMVIFQMV
jgi:hypothetical protein